MNPLQSFDRGQKMHRGFTLLELLLALTLSVALMIAVSTSLLGYYRWRDAGERQIDLARTSLAVTQRVHDDLLRATRTWSESRDPDRPMGLVPLDDDVSIRERVLNFGGEFSLTPLALFGDTDQMALGMMVPLVSLSPRSTEKTPLVHQVVVWSSRPIDSWTIPFTNSAGIVAFGSLRSSSTSVDFVNRDSQTAGRSAAAVKRGVVSLGKTPSLMECVNYPRDVQSIRFRYFDGEDWKARWNSDLMQRLPVAVEAIFMQADDVRPFRQVFFVPGAEPVERARLSSLSLFGNEIVEESP